MSNSLTSVRAVVKELGGVPAVAEITGVKTNAVWNWVSADRFPPYTYFDLRDRLKAKRKSAPDELWKRAVAKSSAASSDLPQVNTLSGA